MIPADFSPTSLIEFGRPEWQAHLGGSFYGPEEHGGVPQNWIGAGRCWVVLTGLDVARDHAIRLEAAPLAPFGAELQQLSLTGANGRRLTQHVFPANSNSTTTGLIVPAAGPAELAWERLGPPALTVSANNQLVTRLTFNSRPDLQSREFLLRRDLLQPNTVLSFEPNFAVPPNATSNAGEKRDLSFRFYRLSVYQLP